MKAYALIYAGGIKSIPIQGIYVLTYTYSKPWEAWGASYFYMRSGYRGVGEFIKY